MDMNKIGVIMGPKDAQVKVGSVPEIKDNEVLVKNMACALCTSDYQHWLGLRKHMKFNMAFGHENAGVVVKVGKNVKQVSVGDHVAVGVLGCGTCSDCKKGLNLKKCNFVVSSHDIKSEDGLIGPRGASTYKAVEERKVFQMRKDLPFESGAFLEPLATVVEGIERLRVQAGETVLVIGAGTMGNLNAQVARLYGANVIISDLSEKKLQTAKHMGFTSLINPKTDNFEEKVKEFTNGKGPDAIVVCVGLTAAYKQTFEIAPLCCRILLFAASYPAPDWGVKLDPNLVHYKLWEIIGTYTASVGNFQKAIDFINLNQVDVASLMEETYGIDDIQQAFEHASKPDQYRVILKISDEM